MSIKWNDIPWNEDTDPEIKADQFDAQYEENARIAEQKREENK